MRPAPLGPAPSSSSKHPTEISPPASPPRGPSPLKGHPATVGISSYLANKLLDHATGRASFTMPAGVHAKFHTGDPGAAGTSNASSQTNRAAVTFAAAAAGAIAMNNTPS